MSKKKKKTSKGCPIPFRHKPEYEDYHHLLFQKRHWAQGSAKVLREHPYCGGYIPQSTLHREIHSKIHDVPVPNSNDCKAMLKKLNDMLKVGIISFDDRLDRKAKVIASLLPASCSATAAILNWQSDVISKFYGRR